MPWDSASFRDWKDEEDLAKETGEMINWRGQEQEKVVSWKPGGGRFQNGGSGQLCQDWLTGQEE